MNIDEMLDVCNYMDSKIKNIEKNDDEFIFFICGKVKEKLIHVSSVGQRGTIATAMFNVANQNEAIEDMIITSVQLLNKHKELNK